MGRYFFFLFTWIVYGSIYSIRSELNSPNIWISTMNSKHNQSYLLICMLSLIQLAQRYAYWRTIIRKYSTITFHCINSFSPNHRLLPVWIISCVSIMKKLYYEIHICAVWILVVTRTKFMFQVISIWNCIVRWLNCFKNFKGRD